MWSRCILAVLVVACLAARPAMAQQDEPASDNARLLELIRSLEGKLDKLGPEKGDRVEQLGSSMRFRSEEPRMIVRFYDLSDLFAVAPPYPARHTSDLGGEERPMFPTATMELSGGGMGGGMFSVPDDLPRVAEPRHRTLHQQFAGGAMNTPRTSIDRLIEVITSTITPEEWDDVGGPASVTTLGDSLLVSAKEDTHDQLDALLKSLRKRWNALRTISLRANWVWLTEAQLAGLLDNADDAPAYGLVDEAPWWRLIEQQAADESARGGYRAVITCYNGQTVHTVSGGQQVAVTRMTPVVGGGGNPGPAAVAYQPTASIVQEGAALQVTPISTINAKYVELDVHSRVVEVRPPEEPDEPPAKTARLPYGPPTPEVEAVVAALDRPVVVQHRLSTTLRVPTDRRMLVGGMTFEGRPSPGEPDLYLFIKVSVQELRDDQPEAEPEAKPAEKPKEKPAAKPAKK